MARFWMNTTAPRLFGVGFPYATLMVNLLGSFLISTVMAVSLSSALIPVNLRIFLTTGIIGGFTTYSAFNYETLAAFQERLWWVGGLNLVGTVLGCLVAGLLGLLVAKVLVGG
jgi:fluoride exporter